MMSYLKNNLTDRKSCIYTPYYCEENIWHLCKQIKSLNFEYESYCVFISNHTQSIVLWEQRLHPKYEEFVIWDYHVIAITGNREVGYHVFDFDSTLPFPTSFTEYAGKAIRSEEQIADIYKRLFRVITVDEYVKNFSSDRRHMKIGDSYKKPPPNYPPIILNEGNPYNLDEFICMDKKKGFGEVLNYENFIKKFCA